MELAPGYLYGTYKLEARLGGGSFGSVWRATDTQANRTVAIKIMSGTYSESESAQLRTDVELLAAAAGAGSAHIVRVLGGGMEPSAHVVMEYLEGTDLAAYLASRGRLPQSEVLDIGAAVLDALGALAAVGIIHRDVKPANIMLCADGAVKLTDFGIAKIVGFDTATSTGQLPLTMAYAAPEVWDGNATGSSDLYALAVVMYQCLAGRLPFAGSYSEVYRGHLSGTPDFDLLPPETAPALRTLIESCLAKDPSARPSTPQSALDELGRAKAELEARRGAPGGHPPVAFGPWQIVAPHPSRTWAWGARHEKTGQRAIVEVCFGPSAEIGEKLKTAVEANSQLVPLGAERLLGTNRLILRPDEQWPAPPPSGPYAFWVAREELPTPPPATMGEPELRRVLESVVLLRTTANAAGVRLDLGPTALVALPDGTVHVRRPGLPPDTTLDPDAAALDSIRKMPLELGLTATVARAPNLAALGRDLHVEGFAPSQHERTVVMTAGAAEAAGADRAYGEPLQPRVVPVPFPAPREDGRGRKRRRVLVPLLLAGFVIAIAAAAAFGAFWASAPGSTPSASSQIAGVESSSTVGATATSMPAAQVDSSATLAPETSQITQNPGGAPTKPPAAGPTKPPVAPPPGVTAGPTKPPTPAPTPAPTPTPTPFLPPNTPSGVSVMVSSMTAIWIGWSESSSGVTGFQVTDGSSTVTLAAGTSSYSWTVSPGTSKCLQVNAYNGAGSSGWAGSCAGPTPTPTPAPPRLTTGSQAQADYNAGLPGVYCKNPAKTTNWIRATADLANFADYGMADDGLVCAVLGNYQATPYDDANWTGYQNAYWEPRHPDFAARGTNVSSIRVQYQGS